MATESESDEFAHAGAEAAQAADAAQRALKDAIAAAEKGVQEAAKTAERMMKEAVETVREKAKAYSGPATQGVDDAQKFIVERVKERPVTATLAGLGVGFLLGLILASRGE